MWSCTQVAFICRFNNIENYPWGPVKCSLKEQVVFIYMQSLEQVSLYFYLGLSKESLLNIEAQEPEYIPTIFVFQ